MSKCNCKMEIIEKIHVMIHEGATVRDIDNYIDEQCGRNLGFEEKEVDIVDVVNNMVKM